MDEKIKNILLGTSIGLLVLSCVGWVGVKIDAMRWTSNNITMEKKVSANHKNYNAKLAKLQEEVIQDNASSSNPALKSLSVQNGSEKVVSSVGEHFFKTLYTYEDANQYKSIKDRLSSYASSNLLKDKSIVGDKKSVEMVKATGLTSEFNNAKFWIENVDNNNVTALARVKYTSSFSGGQEGTGIRVYELNYDKGQQKITKIQLVQNSVEN